MPPGSRSFNAYVFTTGSNISAALIRAHHRRVDVRLVADRYSPNSTCCRVD
jgi:hypothetical protein